MDLAPSSSDTHFEAEMSVKANKGRCPACAVSKSKHLGTVRYDENAGVSPPQRDLFECHNCGLIFLEHTYSPTSIIETYEELPATAWDEILKRRDFDLAREAILAKLTKGRVLDIGCFRGDFLSTLPDNFQRFGIEPSSAAADVAKSRGITIVGRSVEEIASLDLQFDVILLTDVVEHLFDPFTVLRKVAGWLTPGGELIVSTGNTDALPWRMMRLNYWYYIPQHICFYNRRWFKWLSGELGLRVTNVHTFSHSRSAYGKAFVFNRWKEMARCCVFWTRQKLGLLGPARSSPGTATWPDHLLVVMQASNGGK